MAIFKDYNEVDLLIKLLSYVNVSSSQDMYYTIAHTILTHLELIPDISINDLAKLCYTSPATISRFCKDLNCGSFVEFKQYMAHALEISQDEIHFDKESLDGLISQPQSLINKVYDDTIQSLKLGENSLGIEDIDQICRFIYEAQKVHMIGYQFNKIIANDFQMKMLKLKKLIYAFIERGDDIQRLDMIDDNSLVIIVSVRARKVLMDSLIRKLKENNPRIIMLTMSQNYKNPDLDFVLRIQGNESSYSESSIQGTINFLSLLNTIYLRYGLLYKEEV